MTMVEALPGGPTIQNAIIRIWEDFFFAVVYWAGLEYGGSLCLTAKIGYQSNH